MSDKQRYIYADNAATTRLDPSALEAMMPFLQNDFANPSNPSAMGRLARNALSGGRKRIAECIGAYPDEIFFTSGGTESNNWALKGLAEANENKGKHIITSEIEHSSVLKCCRHLEKLGSEITFLSVDNRGHISVAGLRSAIRPDTIAISLMTANNEIGTIQDISSLGAVAREFDIPFHTDAVQAVGHIPIDVNTLNAGLLSASAHKFNGPKGIGFLYKKREIILPPLLDGGTQEGALRAGTENVAGIAGMAAALDANISAIKQNMNHLNMLEELFVDEIRRILSFVCVNGDSESRLPGHISISFPEQSGESLLHILDMKGFVVATGSACDSNHTRISHVLKAIDLPEELAAGTLRITLGKDNSKEDILALVHELTTIILKKTC